MRRPGRILACAVLAGALALAGALLPAAAALAAAEEGTSGSTAPEERAIPIAPVDPASRSGRIVYAIADWLEQRFGSGSEGLRLMLDAPMHAEERDGTVIVHIPGARLARSPKSKPELAFGDLAIAVTPRSETLYDFQSVFPAAIDGEHERLTIGEGAVSGTWRSDLETTTRLSVRTADIRLARSGKSEPPKLLLGALTLEDEIFRGEDGLWDGRFSLGLSDLKAGANSLGGLEIAGSFEDLDQVAILEMRRDFDPFAGAEPGTETLDDLLAPFIAAEFGRSDITVSLHDLTAVDDDWGLSDDGVFRLDRLDWHIEFDSRSDLADLATRVSVSEPSLGGADAGVLPPGFMPHALTLDIALSRLPLRRIAQLISELSARGEAPTPDQELTGDELLGPMDAADTAFEIREIRIDAPSYAFRADGRFNVEQASRFGIVGRLDARIRGLSKLMAMAAEKGEEDAVALLIVLQGLGQPVFEEGADEPVHAYELDLRRDGAVTVNGLPLDVLFQGSLSPP